MHKNKNQRILQPLLDRFQALGQDLLIMEKEITNLTTYLQNFCEQSYLRVRKKSMKGYIMVYELVCLSIEVKMVRIE